MASYNLDASPGPDGQKDDSKKVSFRFCRECSNMLYPKEDPVNHTLLFSCRTCQFEEPADTACIYRNSLKETIAETPGNVQDVAQDPTVGNDEDTQMAPDCDRDSAMEMDLAEDAQGVDIVPYMCTYCGEEILCPVCGGPTDSYVELQAPNPEAEVQEKGEAVVEQEKRERALSGTGLTVL